MRRRGGVRERGRVATLLALVVPAVLVAACTGDAKRFRPLKQGDMAPMFAARTIANEPVELASYHGQTLVLNIWATWCVPCRREMPMLDSLQAAYRERGVAVVGVSVDGDGADRDVQSFIDEHHIGFRILRDPESRVTRAYQTRGVPETFLVDRNGRIAAHWIGGVDAATSGIRDSIDRVLKRGGE